MGAIVLVSTIPLAAVVLDPGGWYPFGPSRWLVVPTVLLAGAALLLWDRPLGPDRLVTRLAWLLVAWLALAAAFGVDRIYAWTGTPERHLGVLTWAIAAIALTAGQCLDTIRDRAALTGALVVAGVGAGAFATAEALGWEPSVFAVTAGRLTATMGSAAYLGAVAALLLPALAGIAADRALARGLRIGSGIGVVLLTVAVLGSGARAAWFGLTVAALVVVVVRRHTLFAHRRRVILLGAGAAVLLGALVVFSPVGARLLAATDRDAGGGSSRIDEWQVATRVIVAHPVLGVGPEGYRIAFAHAVDDRYEEAYGRDPLPDRAHSGPLDVAVAGGLPALVLWAAVIVLVLRASVRAMRTEQRWVAGLGAGLVAHVAGQLLLFPTAELEPVVWLLAGVVVTATSRAPVAAPRSARRPAAVAVGALAFVSLVAGVFDVAADRQAATAAAAGRRGDTRLAVAAATTAVARRPDEVRLHLLLARARVADGEPTALALDAVNDAAQVSPADPVVRRERGRLLVQRAAGTHLPADITAARDETRTLVDEDPANAALWLLAGTADRLAGDAPATEAAFTRAEQLAPRDPVPSIELALLYLDTGRVEAGQAAAARALARDPSDARAAAVARRAMAAH